MNNTEAAQIIREISKSINEDPAQFRFNININSVGFQASNASGAGFIVNPQGGGPGSTTIGMQASGPSNLDIQIRKGAADNEIKEQLKQATGLMDEMAQELEKSRPDHSLVERCLGSLEQSIVPASVTAVVKKIISLFFEA